MKTIINIKQREALSASLLIDDEVNSDPKSVANEFNSYFSTVAGKLQKSIKTRDHDFRDYLPPETESSILIHSSTKEEVIEIINNYLINKKRSKIHDYQYYITLVSINNGKNKYPHIKHIADQK